eukprot:1142779-Prymnesium_polylepis.1
MSLRRRARRTLHRAVARALGPYTPRGRPLGTRQHSGRGESVCGRTNMSSPLPEPHPLPCGTSCSFGPSILVANLRSFASHSLHTAAVSARIVRVVPGSWSPEPRSADTMVNVCVVVR